MRYTLEHNDDGTWTGRHTGFDYLEAVEDTPEEALHQIQEMVAFERDRLNDQRP